MSHGYSTDLRKRAMSYYDSGKTQAQVCKTFEISLRTFGRWVQMRKVSGCFSLKERPFHRAQRKLQEQDLADYINKHPDHFLWEIAKHFGTATSSAFDACKKFGITRKKNDPLHRAIGRKKISLPKENSNAKP